ncbi:hypothetical protein E2C01_078504 [Portunus trituberculatus]|uniref:Uncharacterized protein n=1 Tax=Portunus trituberculatus TaxID=210409 RepID=A0A5B7ISY6_PORTR|nr:hypothetical protein [Portunus trituberculatus]
MTLLLTLNLTSHSYFHSGRRDTGGGVLLFPRGREWLPGVSELPSGVPAGEGVLLRYPASLAKALRRETDGGGTGRRPRRGGRLLSEGLAHPAVLCAGARRQDLRQQRHGASLPVPVPAWVLGPASGVPRGAGGRGAHWLQGQVSL